MFGLKPGESSVALRVLVDVNAVESFAQGGRAQLSNPGVLHNVSYLERSAAVPVRHGAPPGGSQGNASSWNTSLALIGQTAHPITVDVGVWPLAFPQPSD